MYTTHTYQDWLATPEHERPDLAREIVRSYSGSAEFRRTTTHPTAQRASAGFSTGGNDGCSFFMVIASK